MDVFEGLATRTPKEGQMNRMGRINDLFQIAGEEVGSAAAKIALLNQKLAIPCGIAHRSERFGGMGTNGQIALRQQQS